MLKQSIKCAVTLSKPSEVPVLNKSITGYIKNEHDAHQDDYTATKSAGFTEGKTNCKNKFTWDLATHSIGDGVLLHVEFEKSPVEEKVAVTCSRKQNQDVSTASGSARGRGWGWGGPTVWSHLW
ncbi:hypothetical protein K504DRAFT_462038 [Pleomassaria siparia CBS 279.74]|uniref:Uncharacterized protein n=1 Tax=Pleomassaria siparia CBS 279.74 TaxID=1314801 RepID=A0A6G1KMA4_9PLEO|nr:hypothetical protein K504DRAFT_462038 [Pleomassaria siparia CBS 279.74]